VKILVTGADGFVGGWLARAALEAGHTVAGVHRSGGQPSAILAPEEQRRIEWREVELRDAGSVGAALAGDWDAVVHLAAVSSGSEARRDPGLAWEVNAAGTARMAETLGGRVGDGSAGPLLLFVSTAEVYGQGAGAARREVDQPAPCSPYAASKLGGEVAVQEVARRTGLRTIVARPFPHTGPGQDLRFVIPALASRLRSAKREGLATITAGRLDPVRDLLDVRDVAAAYLALLHRGTPGEVYNVATGTGYALVAVLERLQRMVGWRVSVEHDPGLARQSDITHLVGDGSRIRSATGWAPRFTFDRTLQDLLDAQTD
jgi:GDP-4-dehydro-6-deoxy-D-mannose reductase